MRKNELRVVSFPDAAVSTEEWTNYVIQHPKGNFFHHPAIYEANKLVPDYEPIGLLVVDQNNEIKALLTGFIHTAKGGALSFLSKRLILLQPPLYSDLEALDLVIKELIARFGRQVVYLELRNSIPLDNKAGAVLTGNGFLYKPHLNFMVDCSVPELAWSAISESKRRQIKKAQKNGAVIIEEPGLDQILDFYVILQNFYHHRIKKPLVPFSYFEALYHNKAGEFETKFLLVKYQGKIIGGIICPLSSKKMIHEHYVIGLDQEYKEAYPSVLATWAAIDYAVRHGIAEFDFMGAGDPDNDYGVREFKSKFGGKQIESGRYVLVSSRIKYFLAETGFKLYQKLKRFS